MHHELSMEGRLCQGRLADVVDVWARWRERLASVMPGMVAVMRLCPDFVAQILTETGRVKHGVLRRA